MPDVRPFRGLRYAGNRVDLSSVLGRPETPDPRHVHLILERTDLPDDGRDAWLRRARLRLTELRRAGILCREEHPSLYVLRRRDAAGRVSSGVFCALDPAGIPGRPDEVRAARIAHLQVAVEPVVASFDEARARRAIASVQEEEADAVWRSGADVLEMWCIDVEDGAARLATLLAHTALEVQQGADIAVAHAEHWRALPAHVRGTDDERPHAARYALAFLHSDDEPWPEVPLGVAWLPLAGRLE